MSEDMENLTELLEQSVAKNGEKPLTNKWLLNILKMLERQPTARLDGGTMTTDDIIRMAKEALGHDFMGQRTIEFAERFAALVAAAEREKLNNGRCIACGNHITEGGGQVVPTLEGSNGQA